MVFTCIRCRNTFNTQHNLNTHSNKAIKCTEFIYCVTCNKTFTTNAKLNIHLDKKNPCIPLKDTSSIQELEIILAIEKEKTSRAENLFRLQMKIKIENSLLKIDAQLKAAKEIEQIKLERKLLTPSNIINNYVTNKILHITNIYINNNVVTNTYKTIIQDATDIAQYVISDEEAIDIYTNSQTIVQINNKLITKFFTSPSVPQNKCLYYIKDAEEFYGTTHDTSGTVVVTLLNYLHDIHPILSTFLRRCYRILINNVAAVMYWPGNMPEAHVFVKYHTMRDTLLQVSDVGVVKSKKDLNWQDLQLSCQIHFLIR